MEAASGSEAVAGAKQHATKFEAYGEILKLIVGSMGLEEAVANKVRNVLLEAGGPQAKKHLPTIDAAEQRALGEILSETQLFLGRQREGLAAVRLQAVWRGHAQRRRMPEFRRIYIAGRNGSVGEMCYKEVDYCRFLNTIVQKFAAPLLNTADPKLREESVDFHEILRAVMDIEVLHRGLLRKFKWFVTEGVDWPNVNGFGKLFLDLSDDFKAYGKFVKNFKYAIDTLDRIEAFPQERARLYQFLEEKSEDNAGLKALLVKPLNQMTSYELGLQTMAYSTNPEEADFKTLMGALSIINETNKYINASIAQSANKAKVKRVEARIAAVSAKTKTNEELSAFKEMILHAHYDEEVTAEVMVKRGVKKKLPGFVFLFDLAVVVAVQKAGLKGTIDMDTPGILKLKKMYDSKHVRAEQVGDLVQIWETTGEDEAVADVPGSNIKLRVENPIRLVSNVQRIHERTQKKVFGMPLADILEEESNSSGVPFAVQKLCAYMREHCLEKEGIFRVPGSAQKEKILREDFNKNGAKAVDLEAHDATANDAAGMLKLYFRELPDALCGDLFKDFVQTQKAYAGQEAEMTAALKLLVEKLPRNNRMTLHYVCDFMLAVAAHKEVNKMDCSNVAMCIGPDLMKPPVDSIELALMVPQANQALAKMVEHCTGVFGPDDPVGLCAAAEAES